MEDPRTMPGIKQMFKNASFLQSGAGDEASELRMPRMDEECVTSWPREYKEYLG